jgi:hypothetical protein
MTALTNWCNISLPLFHSFLAHVTCNTVLPYVNQEDEFLAKETTLFNLLTKKTTCECNWHKRPPSQWWQRLQATRGTCCRRLWR